jgi:hypothetical protein
VELIEHVENCQSLRIALRILQFLRRYCISILYILLYLNRLINILLFVTTAEAKIVITADQGVRGGELIENGCDSGRKMSDC